MELYEDAVRNPGNHGRHIDGALMLAVFRGKVSEGIDFTDDLARVVISVGIPFPNAMDDMVREKKAYNDNFCKTKSLLTGDQWYVSQAYRALNQALGRCLRHRNDWGALVLIDERLMEQAKPEQRMTTISSARLSKWIRKQLVVYTDYSDFDRSLSEFVRRMQLKDEENCAPKTS
uniref:Regulator of telomere elongation helicase 1 n=1 Tax=Haemonchus contortus TaxID=6289 RepID=W6NN04_HAECO